MKRMHQFALLLSIISIALCSPFDDGKYRPRTYDEYDDGKYYRPLDEGKYIPGDEGRYTYIYRQGNWPFDGTYGYGKKADDPYMGYRVYASRYPYIHGVIKGLVSKYVSSDNINFGEATEGSTNHYSKVYADKEVAVKCTYLKPESNGTEFTTQYPPHLNLEKGEKQGSFYSFKGTKILSTVSNALTNKLRMEYEVFVRVVDDVSSATDNVATTPTSDDLISPLNILRPPKRVVVESSTNNDVKNSISEIVKSLIIDDVLPTVSGVQSSTAEDIKLSVGDIQLLANDDVKPTIGYLQSWYNDDSSSTSSDEKPISSDVKPTSSDVNPTSSDVEPIISDIKPTSGDVTTSTPDDVMPTISDVKPISSVMKPVSSDIKPTSVAVKMPTADNVMPTISDVMPISSDVNPISSDIKPTSSDVTTSNPDYVIPTISDVNPTGVDVTTSTADDVMPTISESKLSSSVAKPISSDIKPTNGDVTTLTADVVMPTISDVQYLFDDSANITTVPEQPTTEAGQR